MRNRVAVMLTLVSAGHVCDTEAKVAQCPPPLLPMPGEQEGRPLGLANPSSLPIDPFRPPCHQRGTF